jgi:hypothetical protein
VALQVTDVFTDFRSCVLSCCQISRGNEEVICAAGAGSIPYLW